MIDSCPEFLTFIISGAKLRIKLEKTEKFALKFWLIT